MPYRPSYGELFAPATSYVGAIAPASIAGGFIGTCLIIAYFLGTNAPEFVPTTLPNLIVGLLALGFALAIGTIGAAFVVAFYILLFGLPIALLLRENLKRFDGLIAACAAAILAAVIATFGFTDLPGSQVEGVPWQPLLIALSFALPAGIFYRNMIVAMLDERDLD